MDRSRTAENSVSPNRIADSLMRSELWKNQKGEDPSVTGFIQAVSRAEKKKDKRKQYTTSETN